VVGPGSVVVGAGSVVVGAGLVVVGAGSVVVGTGSVVVELTIGGRSVVVGTSVGDVVGSTVVVFCGGRMAVVTSDTMLLKMLLIWPRPSSVVVDDVVGAGALVGSVLVDDVTMPVGASRILLVLDDVGGATAVVALVVLSSVFVVGWTIVSGSPPVDEAVPSPPSVEVGGSTRVVMVTTVVTLSELLPEEESVGDEVDSDGGFTTLGMNDKKSEKDVCLFVVSGAVPANSVASGAGCGVFWVMVALTNCRFTLRGKYIRGRSSSALTADAEAASATRSALLCMLDKMVASSSHYRSSKNDRGG
jgi:hypothetical protein